jgi:hypothetical protein
VRVALNGLPHEQFTLVRLAFFEGLSHSDHRAQLNLPLGTVKSRLRLACARLRRSLLDAGVTEALQSINPSFRDAADLKLIRSLVTCFQSPRVPCLWIPG